MKMLRLERAVKALKEENQQLRQQIDATKLELQNAISDLEQRFAKLEQRKKPGPKPKGERHRDHPSGLQ